MYAKREKDFLPLTSPIQPANPGCWDRTPQVVKLFKEFFKNPTFWCSK